MTTRPRRIQSEASNRREDQGAGAPATSSACHEPRFSVKNHRSELSDTILSAHEVKGLDPTEFDFHWDRGFGLIQIRAADESIISYQLDIPGLGPVGETLLTALMDHPGELMTPWDIVRATGYRWFYNKNNLAGRLAALRSAFGEDGNHPHFFLTRRHPYAVCWSAERTWRVIDKIRSQEAEQ